MSVTERVGSKLPIPGPTSRPLADVHFEEFAISPVDEVVRAIDRRGDAGRRLKATIVEQHIFGRAPVLVGYAEVELLAAIAGHHWNNPFDEATYTQEVVYTKAVPRPRELNLYGDFSPSKRLTDIWISGLLELGREAGRTTTQTADFETAQEFSKTLSAVFGTIAQQLRFRTTDHDLSITKNAKFTAGYQIAICDAYLIIPDRSPEFLDLLLSEIILGIHSGCRIAGEWGEIVSSVDGRDLRFSLSEPNFETDPEFEESEEVE